METQPEGTPHRAPIERAIASEDIRALGLGPAITVTADTSLYDAVQTLQSANLSAVIFDSSGNVIGGGSGFEFQSLPPGTRAAVQLGNGFDAIPFENAASASISMTTTWKQPGS